MQQNIGEIEASAGPRPADDILNTLQGEAQRPISMSALYCMMFGHASSMIVIMLRCASLPTNLLWFMPPRSS